MKALHDESHRGRGPAGIIDGKVARLIAVGASMAANNESGFNESVESLRALGAHADEVRLAVEVGQTVKDKPAGIMKALADRLTGTSLQSKTPHAGCPAEKVKQTPAYPVVLLIAAGSAMSANCEPCLNKVIPDLIEAGAAEEDIRLALEIGQFVKDQQADLMKEVADVLADTDLSERSIAGSLQTVGLQQRSVCTCA